MSCLICWNQIQVTSQFCYLSNFHNFLEGHVPSQAFTKHSMELDVHLQLKLRSLKSQWLHSLKHSVWSTRSLRNFIARYWTNFIIYYNFLQVIQLYYNWHNYSILQSDQKKIFNPPKLPPESRQWHHRGQHRGSRMATAMTDLRLIGLERDGRMWQYIPSYINITVLCIYKGE